MNIFTINYLKRNNKSFRANRRQRAGSDSGRGDVLCEISRKLLCHQQIRGRGYQRGHQIHRVHGEEGFEKYYLNVSFSEKRLSKFNSISLFDSSRLLPKIFSDIRHTEKLKTHKTFIIQHNPFHLVKVSI